MLLQLDLDVQQTCLGSPGIERKSKIDLQIRDSLFLAIEITETVSAKVVNAERKYQVKWSKIVWPKNVGN